MLSGNAEDDIRIRVECGGSGEMYKGQGERRMANVELLKAKAE
mgnify:CR=1 FL=1